MATEKQIETLTNEFDKIFSDKLELGDRLRTEDEVIAEEITDQALRSEKFPIDANMYNTQIDILIDSGMSTEEWAKSYLDAHNIESREDFQNALNDDLYYFVTDNLEKTKINVIIRESLKEWLEKHGTIEYLTQEMEKAFEPSELENLIEVEAPTVVNEKLREALREEGFPPNTDVSELEYDITDVKLTATFEGLAEKHIDDIESSGGVSSYISNRFEKDIISDEAYSFDIEILSDPEDYQEE